MSNNKEIRISVRNLVEFILRSGDLNAGFTGSGRAVEGTKIHQRIQRSKGKEYSSEVFLKYTFDYKDITMTLEGRADGIINVNGEITIDEIKSTTMPLENIDEEYNPLHFAQAKCYAYIYAKQQKLQYINVQLTYASVDTEETKEIVETYTVEELEEFFYEIIDKYFMWADFNKKWLDERDESIGTVNFPFKNYRKGQREMAVSVYGTIRDGKNIFINAPTGIGKTMSTIFPTVKAMREGLTSKVFYLTAKTITSTVALEAFNKMVEQGLKLKVVFITAKEKLCFCKDSSCNPEQCEYAKGHYNRINQALMDVLKNENIITRESLVKYAEEYKVCPFEFALDLTLWADCVVCDYNYVFDPRVYLKRFFDTGKTDYVFLIDEAHNLVDRGREMYSAELYKSKFNNGKELIKKGTSKIYKALANINREILQLGEKCDENGYYLQEEEPDEMYPYLRSFVKEGEEWLKENENREGYDEVLDLYFEVMAFLRISEYYRKGFVTYVEKSKDGDVKLKLFCLDPSTLLKDSLSMGRAGVLFSATLTPMDYFKEVLGGSEGDYQMRLESPFNKENRTIMVSSNISTKYKVREKSYEKIADYINVFISGKIGNYMVFFPSYTYMQNVKEVFEEKYSEINTTAQSTDMNEEDREEFLLQFKEDAEETLVGFAVLGGIFSEGVDLKGDRLLGAVIVGVGLPQICFERDIIMDYFNEENGKGYDYSYTYPGMNKVLQAAGRVIRSEEDKGLILLIDERFVTSSYQRLFPQEWFPYTRVMGYGLSQTIKSFWESMDKELK